MSEKRRTAKDMQAADKTNKAVEYRLLGMSYREIEELTGISKSAAHRAVTKAFSALESKTAEDAETLLQIELARLDRLQLKIMKAASSGDLAAVDRVLKIMDRRAKLLNLDQQVNRIELSAPQMPSFDPSDEWTEDDQKAIENDPGIE